MLQATQKLFTGSSSGSEPRPAAITSRRHTHPLEKLAAAYGVDGKRAKLAKGELRKSPRVGITHCHVNWKGHGEAHGSTQQADARLAHRKAAMVDFREALRLSVTTHANKLDVSPVEVDGLVDRVCESLKGRVPVETVIHLVGLEMGCFASRKEGLLKVLGLSPSPDLADLILASDVRRWLTASSSSASLTPSPSSARSRSDSVSASVEFDDSPEEVQIHPQSPQAPRELPTPLGTAADDSARAASPPSADAGLRPTDPGLRPQQPARKPPSMPLPALPLPPLPRPPRPPRQATQSQRPPRPLPPLPRLPSRAPSAARACRPPLPDIPAGPAAPLPFREAASAVTPPPTPVASPAATPVAATATASPVQGRQEDRPTRLSMAPQLAVTGKPVQVFVSRGGTLTYGEGVRQAVASIYGAGKQG